MTEFKLRKLGTTQEVIENIRMCEGLHIQQVVYSSYHEALTQICFNCKEIRTNMKDIYKKPNEEEKDD